VWWWWWCGPTYSRKYPHTQGESLSAPGLAGNMLAASRWCGTGRLGRARAGIGFLVFVLSAQECAVIPGDHDHHSSLRPERLAGAGLARRSTASRTARCNPTHARQCVVPGYASSRSF